MKFAGNLFEHYKTYYLHGRLPLLRYVGFVGTVGYPLFYLIYINIIHQAYENLPVRLVATFGCFFLILSDRWPEKLKPYFLPYSYCVLMYCLPFFHVFITLKNHGGIVMIADSFMAIFFLVLLTDWRNTLAMLFVGGGLGVLLYIATTPNPSIPMDYVQRLPTYILIFVGGSLFKFSEKQIADKLEEEKLHGMSTALATVAHEMRTPLVSVSACARGLQRYVAMLINFYEKHSEIMDESEQIPPDRLAMTMPTIERIQSEAKYMNSMIELLLTNATGKLGPPTIERFQIAAVIERTIALYPFESSKQRTLVTTDIQSSFLVDGNEDLCRMVLINLIKNSLRAISRARKGALHISAQQTADGGRLVLRDTASGIPPAQIAKIFKRFYSYPASDGTGIGLAFCRDTLASWGAHISCQSEEGVYTEFVIQFPQVGDTIASTMPVSA